MAWCFTSEMKRSTKTKPSIGAKAPTDSTQVTAWATSVGSSASVRPAPLAMAPAAAAEPDKVIDLMAALEASVAAAKESRKRHPTANEADEEGADGEAGVKKPKKAKAKAKSA